MGDDLSPAEHRVQLALSTFFCFTVTVFGIALVAMGAIQWWEGEVPLAVGAAMAVLGVIFGYFIGVRPLWNQFVRSR